MKKARPLILKGLLLVAVVVGLLLVVTKFKLYADNGSILRPIADGSHESAQWVNKYNVPCTKANCFNQINDLDGGQYCGGLSDGDASYIESGTPGALQTFVIDTSSLPNGTKIDDFKAVICSRTLNGQTTSFTTVLCVNGVCRNADGAIQPTAEYMGATQTYHNLHITKDSNTKIELGYRFIGSPGAKVRISWLSGEGGGSSGGAGVRPGIGGSNNSHVAPYQQRGTGGDSPSEKANAQCKQACASGCNSGRDFGCAGACDNNTMRYTDTLTDAQINTLVAQYCPKAEIK